MAAPKLNAMLAAILKQVQKAEQAIRDVMVSRILGFATAAQLDAIGRVVGEARLAREDDTFRQAIRLRIFINGSSGRPEDLIHVARSLTGFQTVLYRDVSAATCRLVIPGWTPDDGTLLTFLQAICPAGVRLLYVTPSDTFAPRRFGARFGTRYQEI